MFVIFLDISCRYRWEDPIASINGRGEAGGPPFVEGFWLGRRCSDYLQRLGHANGNGPVMLVNSYQDQQALELYQLEWWWLTTVESVGKEYISCGECSYSQLPDARFEHLREAFLQDSLKPCVNRFLPRLCQRLLGMGTRILCHQGRALQGEKKNPPFLRFAVGLTCRRRGSCLNCVDRDDSWSGTTRFGKHWPHLVWQVANQTSARRTCTSRWSLNTSCFKCLAAIHRWFLWNIKFFFQTEVENCRNMPEQEVKHAEFGWICTNLLILNFSTNMNQEMEDHVMPQ